MSPHVKSSNYANKGLTNVHNSLPTRKCCLLQIFANSLNPDQKVEPDRDPN